MKFVVFMLGLFAVACIALLSVPAVGSNGHSQPVGSPIVGIAVTATPIARVVNPTATSQRSSGTPNIGEQAHLTMSTSDLVFVSRDLESSDAFTQALVAKDEIGFNQLLAQGRVFQVEHNTKALVLGFHIPLTHVRILDGDQTGRDGWVPFEWVRP